MIRLATPADIPTIRQIAYVTWPDTYGEILSPAQLSYMLATRYSEEILHQQMTREGHHFLLAEQHGAGVGFAGFEHHYQGADRTRLHKLYILPSAQGSGVGRALLAAALASAKEAGDVTLELNVNRFNKACDFYRRHDFQVLREEVLPIGQGYVMDDYVLIRSTTTPLRTK